MNYTQSFEQAISHAMLYEVGKFWNPAHPAVELGLINTAPNRKAVGYVNDPTDAGGETKFGIAVNANPDLNIKTLSWEAAKRVYFKKYWIASDCHNITLLVPRLSVIHFDGAVNHGVGRASKFLQKAVGVVEDGDIGPVTISALSKKCKTLNGELELCQQVAEYRKVFYNSIVQNKPSQTKFLNGWLTRIDEVEAFVLNNDIKN